MLFSGDHVMEGSTVVIAPPDGDMAQYLASLARSSPSTRPWPPSPRATGRSSRTRAPPCDGIIEHRLEREAVVADALARAGRATVDELLPDGLRRRRTSCRPGGAPSRCGPICASWPTRAGPVATTGDDIEAAWASVA